MKAVIPLLLLSGVLELCFAHPECNGVTRTACENIFTAQKCGIVPQCLRMWKASRWGKYQTDVSADCTFCLHLAKSPVSERSTPLICGVHPSDTSNIRSPLFDTDACIDVAKNLKNISSGKDDAVALCNVLTHCHSHTFIGHLNFGSTLCDDCKKVVNDIRTLIADNATAVEITQRLNDLICTNIPEQFQKFCQDTIKVHVPPLLDLINKHISPQDICTLLGLCPREENMVVQVSQLLSPSLFSEETVSLPQVTHVACPRETKFSWISRPSARGHPKWTSTNHFESLLPTLMDTPSGDECVAVMEQIRKSLKDPENQAKIREGIDKELCDTLPSFLRTMCDNAVNQHFDEMIAELDKVDLKKVCAMFGMPPANVQRQAKSTLPIPGVCRICQIVIGELVNMVVKGATEKEISDTLDQVCRFVPHQYRQQCDEFIEKHGAKIVTAIITGAAPEIICLSFGLCSSPIPVPVVAAAPVPPMGDSYCDTCKLLVTMIEHQLVQNETEAQIEELLKKMCDVLPGSYVSECKNLIDRYLPAVLEYLTKQMNPEQVCEAIQLCTPKHITPLCHRGPAYWCSSRAAAIRCKAEAYCNLTFRKLDVEQPAKQECETGDLDKICGSPELTAKCGKYNECINRRMVQYLHLVSQHTQEPTPNCTVCKQLVNRWKLERELFGGPIVNKDTCTMYKEKADRNQCKLVVKSISDISQLLLQKATDAEAMCKSLALCQMKLPKFGDSSTVLENLPENVGAQVLACSEGPVFWCASKRNAEVCGTVNFCNALSWFGEREDKPKPTTLVEVEVDIFGVNACAWGSVYWCQNEETARRCNALEHCQNVVWRSDRLDDKPRTSQFKPRPPTNPCSWGPSYYCSSPEKAVACGEQYVKRCRQLALQRNHS